VLPFAIVAKASSNSLRIIQNKSILSRFSHISFLPHSSPSLKSLQDGISGNMPPRADKTSKTSTQENSEILEARFKAMLLSALRTDEEVRTTVAHILRSRETDVFTAVVQCIEKTQVRDQIGMFMKLFVIFQISL
jgi:hypothetical protein